MSFDLSDKRAPVVTNADRDWAEAQKPALWDADTQGLEWADHVDEQARRFETYFGADRKTMAEWSGLWRRKWWPAADPAKLHPSTAPHVPHPFVRRGDVAWHAALIVCNPSERKIAERYGVMQFRPTDPRAEILRATP